MTILELWDWVNKGGLIGVALGLGYLLKTGTLLWKYQLKAQEEASDRVIKQLQDWHKETQKDRDGYREIALSGAKQGEIFASKIGK